MLIRRGAPHKAEGEQTKPLVAKKKITDPARGAELAEKLRQTVEVNEALITIHRYNEKIRSPKTAIRAKCVECSGGSLKEVNECPVTSCALHSFRMGVNPHNKRVRERLGLDAGAPQTGEDESDEDDE